MACHLPAHWFFQGCKHVANEKQNFQFLECYILNENPKCCMISVQFLCVVTLHFLVFSRFMHEGHILHDQEICVCENNKILYFRSDEKE